MRPFTLSLSIELALLSILLLSPSQSLSFMVMDRIFMFVIFGFFLSLSAQVEPISFKITNRCRNTIWPGFLSGATSPPLPTTGFRLARAKSRTVRIPPSWSGRLWARTLCSQDPSSGSFVCLTADCGSGKVECSGSGAKPPATLSEFTLNGIIFCPPPYTSEKLLGSGKDGATLPLVNKSMIHLPHPSSS